MNIKYWANYVVIDSILIPLQTSRSGQINEALDFAQSQLSEAGENNPDVLCEIERTLSLLAFEKPQDSPYKDLLEQTYRTVSE